LEIELSAIIKNVSFLRLFCYTLEGDGDSVFQAGKLGNQFFAQYSGEGELCNMPSTNGLIDKSANHFVSIVSLSCLYLLGVWQIESTQD
jgi:hypothetical protein